MCVYPKLERIGGGGRAGGVCAVLHSSFVGKPSSLDFQHQQERIVAPYLTREFPKYMTLSLEVALDGTCFLMADRMKIEAKNLRL